MRKLHWDTVSPVLRSALDELMASHLFHPFRLVGGTALCLQLGHRMSCAIDLYTDAVYGSIDFIVLDNYLRRIFGYVDEHGPGGTGVSYFIGDTADEAVKLDLFYTEPFLTPAAEIEGVRLAGLGDIAAMKTDCIQRGGRKKDYWDVAELLNKYSIDEMLALHNKRYPYDHDEAIARANFTNFSTADNDFEPHCLNGKCWEVIKLDIMDAVQKPQVSHN